jgi:hypothetical protein
MMHRLSDRLLWTGKRARDLLVAARTAVLGVSGLASINVAVWLNSTTFGLVTTGVSLLLLQFLTEPEDHKTQAR